MPTAIWLGDLLWGLVKGPLAIILHPVHPSGIPILALANGLAMSLFSFCSTNRRKKHERDTWQMALVELHKSCAHFLCTKVMQLCSRDLQIAEIDVSASSVMTLRGRY